MKIALRILAPLLFAAHFYIVFYRPYQGWQFDSMYIEPFFGNRIFADGESWSMRLWWAGQALLTYGTLVISVLVFFVGNNRDTSIQPSVSPREEESPMPPGILD